MLNYDFFKFQIYQKNILINLLKKDNPITNYLKENKYFLNINNNYYNHIKKSFEFNNNNNNILKYFDLVKKYFENFENYEEEKNYIFLNNKVLLVLTYYSNDFTDEIKNKIEKDNLIIIGIGNSIFNPKIPYFNYLFFPIGIINTNFNIYNNFFDKFNFCETIGYNSNSLKEYIGYNVGIPIYNNFFPISYYKNLSEINIKEKIFSIKKLKIKNKYLYNVLTYLDEKLNIDLNKYNNFNYITIPNMTSYILKLKIEPDFNIKNLLYKSNNFIVINKKSNEMKRFIIFQNYFLNLLINENNKYMRDIKEYDKMYKMDFYFNKYLNVNININQKYFQNLKKLKKLNFLIKIMI